MSRVPRRLLDGCCYHVTHRCHDRAFLFRFIRERDEYVQLLREMSAKYAVDVLDYMVTSNHVHLLLWAPKSAQISESMRFVQGTVAQRYNRRRQREGSFWQNRFHATLIQDGVHLARCLFYIEFNMVRAKVVTHPAKWRWSGYDELIGARQRYRVLNRGSLARRLRGEDGPELSEWFRLTMEEKLVSYHVREPHWSDSVAVGDKSWIEALAVALPSGRVAMQPVSRETPGTTGMHDASESYFLTASAHDSAWLTRQL